MVDKRVIARERSYRGNLAQITGLLRLRLAMTASDFSIIVKNIAIFQQSQFVNYPYTAIFNFWLVGAVRGPPVTL